MDIDQRTVAMGVVVQILVHADVSGVLFTANPSSGDRSELVVNSSFGLGEAVVGGQVTPDTYVLDRTSFAIKETRIGTKDEMTVAAGQHGTTTQPVRDRKRNESSLSAETLRELASMSVDVERIFAGLPQDIEWATADGKCWLLQSRPITNLPPAPLKDVRWDPPRKGAKLVRRQVVENMPGPLSPLFDELYLHDGMEQSIDKFMADFGMSFDVEVFLERPMFLTVNGYAYCRADYRISWRLLWLIPKILYGYVKILPRLFRTLISQWRDERLPAYLGTIEHWKSLDPTTTPDEQLLAGVRALTVADTNYWFDVAIILGAAKVTDGLLNLFLTSPAVPGDLTSGMFLCGFPSKTMEAQEELEAIAQRIREVESLHDLVRSSPAVNLLESCKCDSRGQSFLEDIDQYLKKYGHQIYTLDFAEPTQAEDPLPVLMSLKALVNDEEYETTSRQAEMRHERETRVKGTLKSLGPLRRWLFRTFLRWAQLYGPHREEALFYMGAAWPTLPTSGPGTWAAAGRRQHASHTR